MEDVTVSQARQENFLFLFREYRERHADQPDRGMLKAFSAEVGLSQTYASHIKCGRKSIGHALARQLEAVFSLPEGWMDRRHSELEPTDAGERMFVETLLSLYRTAPDEARRLMMETVKERLGKNGK